MSDIQVDLFYLGLARYMANRGTCPAKKVGAVIVDHDLDTVISVGYNDAPIGIQKCGGECANRQIGENNKACQAVHAEMNAILNAMKMGHSVSGKWMYVTISPCLNCARVMIQSGITRMVASSFSPYEKALTILKEAGVEVMVLKGVTFPKMIIPSVMSVEALSEEIS